MADQTIDFDQDTAPEPMPRPQAVQPGIPQQPSVAPQEVEVDPNQALTEAQEGDKTKEKEPEEEKPQEDVVDILVPKDEPRVWQFGPKDMPLEYVQRPLSFIAKMQWFSLVGEVLEKAMAGPDGVSVNELLSGPGRREQQLTLADFRDADTFIRALGKLVVHAPTFITQSYCIWLGVPDHQRKVVAEIMALPEIEGGLTDEQGLEIIEVFIDQNYDALADFFGGKVGTLQKRIKARQQARQKRTPVRR